MTPPCPWTLTGVPGDQPVLARDRGILAAAWCLEAVAEAGAQRQRGRLVGPDVDLAAVVDEQRPQIVDAVGMVGVLMGEQDAVQPVDLGVQKLFAQVRRAVDQNARHAVGAGALDQERAAAPAVFRVVRVAIAPANADARHAHGRPAAEDGEGQTHAAAPNSRGTLLNRQ